jgi:hypothetical protein
MILVTGAVGARVDAPAAQPVHAGLIPEEVVERPEGSLEAGYEAEYLVEPEHIKEGLEV